MELEWIGKFIADYGINGVGMIALVIIAYTRMLETKNKKQELENEGHADELEGKEDAVNAKIELEKMQIMSRMLSQSEGMTAGLQDVVSAINTGSAQQTTEHERLIAMTMTHGDKLDIIASTAMDTQAATHKANLAIGGIMSKLNEPEKNPTTSQKLDTLIEAVQGLSRKIDRIAQTHQATGEEISEVKKRTEKVEQDTIKLKEDFEKQSVPEFIAPIESPKPTEEKDKPND